METLFIGDKKVKSVNKSKEKTAGGIGIMEVEFEDGKIEHFSELLYSKITSGEPCDATALREKRIFPVVQSVLVLLRDWGIKISELPYMSAVLNQSLDYNSKEALNELWSKWMPKPSSPEDVDLITVDRVLSSKRKTLNDVI